MATPTSKKPSTRASQPAAPTLDEIAERAYEIFVAGGGQHGHDVENWLEAESELLNERAMRRTPKDGA